MCSRKRDSTPKNNLWEGHTWGAYMNHLFQDWSLEVIHPIDVHLATRHVIRLGILILMCSPTARQPATKPLMRHTHSQGSAIMSEHMPPSTVSPTVSPMWSCGTEVFWTNTEFSTRLIRLDRLASRSSSLSPTFSPAT